MLEVGRHRSHPGRREMQFTVQQYVCILIMPYTVAKRMNRPGKVINLARGISWTENMSFSLSPFAHRNLVLRDRFGRPIPHQPAHSSTFRLNLLYRQRHLLRTAYFARGWRLIDRSKPSTCSYLPCSYLTIRLPPRCSGCLFLFQYSLSTCPIMLCSTVCCAVQQ